MKHKVPSTYKCCFCIEVSVQNTYIVPDRIVLLSPDKRGVVAHLFTPVDTFGQVTCLSVMTHWTNTNVS